MKRSAEPESVMPRSTISPISTCWHWIRYVEGNSFVRSEDRSKMIATKAQRCSPGSKEMLRDCVELVCIFIKAKTKGATIMCLGEVLGWISGLGAKSELTSLESIQKREAIVCLRAIHWESDAALPHNAVNFVTLGSFPAAEPHRVLKWAVVCHSRQLLSNVEAPGTVRPSFKLKSQVLQSCVERWGLLHLQALQWILEAKVV